MSDDHNRRNNVDRLLEHLEEDSLAARLVSASHDSADPVEEMKGVLTERLELAKERVDGSAD